MTQKMNKTNVVEVRTIDYIPEEERFGRLSSQFSLWLGANLQITAIVTGSLTTVFGGDVVWSIIGLFIGQVFGTIVMALHAAQGPKIGLPQMISSRVQFGILGACIPIALVCLMYLGFTATGVLLSAQALAQLFNINVVTGIIIFASTVIVLASLGYHWIHMAGRVTSIIGIILFIYLFFTTLSNTNVNELLASNEFTWSGFFMAISLSASWQIAYGPYVADYSRYLPTKTSAKSVFWAVGSGTFIGSMVTMILGVIIGFMAGKNFLGHEVDSIVQLSGSTGLMAAFILLSIPIGKLTITVLNAYGTFMCMTTITSSFSGRTAYTKNHRFLVVLAMVLLSCILAYFGVQYGFLKAFKGFILFLLTFFIPWSAINLVDYYFFSKNHIDVKALADINGKYRAWNKIGISCYLFGVLLQFPFIDSPFYTGLIAADLGNLDLSWLIGIVATALVYYVLIKKYRTPAQLPLPQQV